MPVARHFLFLLVQAVHARAGDEARMCLRVCSLGCAHSGERTARQSSPRATFLQAFSFRRANAARSENDSFSEPIDDRQVFSFVSSAQSAASQESQIVAIVLNVLVALALQKRHHRSLFWALCSCGQPEFAWKEAQIDGEARRLAGILVLIFPDLELRDDELKSILRQSNDDMVLIYILYWYWLPSRCCLSYISNMRDQLESVVQTCICLIVIWTLTDSFANRNQWSQVQAIVLAQDRYGTQF